MLLYISDINYFLTIFTFVKSVNRISKITFNNCENNAISYIAINSWRGNPQLLLLIS